MQEGSRSETRLGTLLKRGGRPSLLALATLTACGGDAATDPQQPGAEVGFVGAPAEGPQTTGALPQLANFPANTELGYMSTWVELGGKPAQMDGNWVTKTVGEDAYTAPTSLKPRLNEARDRAQANANEAIVTVPKELSKVIELFDYYTPETGQLRLVGYTPERARWLSERTKGGKKETFTDPLGFAELRQRGARLYCAATAAYNHRSRKNRLMGKTMAAGVSIFGAPIGLTVIEPTISLRKPMRFDSGKADGAQAFLLPFDAGVRMTPISFLFGLPELKIPVGFVTADSELSSRAQVKGNDYEQWTTMSHVDGFASASQPYFKSSLPEFTLFQMPYFALRVKLTLDMGAAACSQAASYPECVAQGLREPGRLYASTKDPDGSVHKWPGARSGGWTSEVSKVPFSYHNGPWDIDTATWRASPSGSGFSFETRLPDPLAGRMLQNNDKSMEVHTSSGVTVGLVGAGGVSAKDLGLPDFFELSVTATGSLRAGVNMIHRFREQEEMVLGPEGIRYGEEFAHPIPNMVTSLSVTPASAKDFTIGFDIGFRLIIKLGIFETVISPSFPVAKKTFTSGLEEWPENRRLRMDTAISDGITPSFNVGSHWPRSDGFATYENIEGCQAPQTTAEPAEPPCTTSNKDKPMPTDFKPIQGQMCMWREQNVLNPDFLPSEWADEACWRAMQSWMEGGVYKIQPWEGKSGVYARVTHFEDRADMEGMYAALSQCEAEYTKVGRTQDLSKVLHVQPCDASATLQTEIIAPVWIDKSAAEMGAAGEPDSCD